MLQASALQRVLVKPRKDIQTTEEEVQVLSQNLSQYKFKMQACPTKNCLFTDDILHLIQQTESQGLYQSYQNHYIDINIYVNLLRSTQHLYNLYYLGHFEFHTYNAVDRASVFQQQNFHHQIKVKKFQCKYKSISVESKGFQDYFIFRGRRKKMYSSSDKF